LTQVTTSSNAGFFGYIGATGTVKNVTITNGTITKNGTGRECIGGFAGLEEERANPRTHASVSAIMEACGMRFCHKASTQRDTVY